MSKYFRDCRPNLFAEPHENLPDTIKGWVILQVLEAQFVFEK